MVAQKVDSLESKMVGLMDERKAGLLAGLMADLSVVLTVTSMADQMVDRLV